MVVTMFGVPSTLEKMVDFLEPASVYYKAPSISEQEYPGLVLVQL